MLNILCGKCKNRVFSDLTDTVELLASFGIGNKSTKIGMGNIQFKAQGKAFPAKYKCTSCNVHVPINNLVGMCHFCGNEFPVGNIVKLQIKGQGAGISCEECAKEIEYSSSIKLSDILKKIWISR